MKTFDWTFLSASGPLVNMMDETYIHRRHLFEMRGRNRENVGSSCDLDILFSNPEDF
jgi:hypothetical protein